MRKDVEALDGGHMATPSSYPYPPGPAPSIDPPYDPYLAGPSGLMPGQTVTVVIAHPPALKSLGEAYLLCFPLGLLGLHNFYLRRYGWGVLYLLTGGVCGVGWIVDLVRMNWLVKDANRRILHPEEDVATVGVCDAYVTWFPLGIVGAHHYYLRNWAWGVAYTFTAGLFGLGWLFDVFRIPSMVRTTNERLEVERMNTIPREVSLCEAYALGVTPAGIFGAHHFYMGRTSFGVFYMLTLGGCGIGWIVDWFRMKWLVHRANHPEERVLGTRHKFVDDAYVLAFPLGILGLHHFYLERHVWGVLYLFTLGLFGIGWLVDLCRMPCLVSGANERIEEELRMVVEIRDQLGVQPTGVIHREIHYPHTPIGNVLPVNYNFPGQQHPQHPQHPQQPPSYEASVATAGGGGGGGEGGGLATGGSTYVATPEESYQNGGFEKEKY